MADKNATSPGSPSLELVTEPARSARRYVAVLFVHGINVGAWVWEENFLPYFAAAGFDAHALSFRGHGRSEGHERIRDWRLQDYVRDLASVVDRIGTPLVLIGHSLGGAVVQRFIRCGERADVSCPLLSGPRTCLHDDAVQLPGAEWLEVVLAGEQPAVDMQHALPPADPRPLPQQRQQSGR